MLVRADVDETDVVDMRGRPEGEDHGRRVAGHVVRGHRDEIGNTAKRSLTSAVEGQTNFEVKVVFDQDVPPGAARA